MAENFKPDLIIVTQISLLQGLVDILANVSNIEAKNKILSDQPSVQEYLNQNPNHRLIFQKLESLKKYVIFSVITLGQGPTIFQKFATDVMNKNLLSELINVLLSVEKFYDTIGGIIGYHLTILKLISQKNEGISSKDKGIFYRHPEGIQLDPLNPKIHENIRWGIESLPLMGEIYPVGGAGDRLNLCHSESGQPLPAAQLSFRGRTLLEGLIRDLQGKEYLYYKLFNIQLVTPIAMMTSHEKNNHNLVIDICETKNWFGRPKENFKFFVQPFVPVLTKKGFWAVSSPLHLVLKPGGHGVIWKLAEDNHVFEWFKQNKRKKGLVRQINNPIAGTDYGLIAFAGIGCKKDKPFGFASCPRRMNTAEGMNVLVEKKIDEIFSYCITNVEYTDFEKNGIQDIPAEPGSHFSAFPANTNLLFIDFGAVQKAVKANPIPGMLINMKNKLNCLDPEGNSIAIEAGRLESTMQNLADVITDRFDHPLKEGEQDKLSTFLTFYERTKTISVTKKSYQKDKSILETPEGCFYEMLLNYQQAFTQYCQFIIPPVGSEDEFLRNGPSFIIDLHPALGPIFDIIGQKIRKGSIANRAELVLEIAEVDIQNLQLQGSLRILAENVMGAQNYHLIEFGKHTAKCTLKNVTVSNQGIDFEAQNCYWKNEITRKESVLLELLGNSELHAEDILIKGPLHIVVPHNHRAILTQSENEIHVEMQKISMPSWEWHYAFNQQSRVALTRSTIGQPSQLASK